MQWIAQILGYLTIVLSFFMYQQKTRRGILTCKLTIDLFWTLHYALIGAFSASAVSLLNIFRDIVFFNKARKWAGHSVWLAVFAALYLTSAALTWQNLFSVFPAMSSIISMFALWLNRPSRTKLLLIPASLCTLVYNIMQGHSPATYVALAISFSSTALFFIRQAIQNKRPA